MSGQGKKIRDRNKRNKHDNHVGKFHKNETKHIPFDVPDNLNLNDEQRHAVNKLTAWWNDRDGKQVFEITGAAGTGKTTLIKYLMKKIGLFQDEVLFTAYVGKAALAMTRSSGVKAKTIHSTICYSLDSDKLDENGEPIKIYGRIAKKKTFTRKPYLQDGVKLIVVDEGSMVPEKLARWLLDYGIRIIVLGDLNQLPPVAGSSFFLKHPDVVLTKIMRQANDSPIPYFAKNILDYGPYGVLQVGSMGLNKEVEIISRAQLREEHFKEADVVLCGRNKTRDALNKYIREKIYGRTNAIPVIGDKLICRENDWDKRIAGDIYLINGLIGYVDDIQLESVNAETMKFDFRPEFLEDETFKNLMLDRTFMKLTPDQKKYYRSYFSKFEYGYAITCHLAQGSQYDNVLVIYERMFDYAYSKAWLYTCATRAIKKLTIVI